MKRLIALALACALLASCVTPGSEAEFRRWLAGDPSREAMFVRFQAFLLEAGVGDVVPAHQLWLVDRLNAACVQQPYSAPPEEVWPNIVPALRFVRDHVKPPIGDVVVASAYRDEAFNTCIRGAPQSAHRGFHAVDLVPADARVDRDELIAALCPLHAREGEAAALGLGIYRGRRFHIDVRGFRGWGPDYRRTTFPCDAL